MASSTYGKKQPPKFSVSEAINYFRSEILVKFGYADIMVDDGRMHCAKHQDNNPSAKLWEDDKGFYCAVCGYVDALELIRVWRPDLDFPARLTLAREIDPGGGSKVRRRRNNSHGLF